MRIGSNHSRPYVADWSSNNVDKRVHFQAHSNWSISQRHGDDCEILPGWNLNLEHKNVNYLIKGLATQSPLLRRASVSCEIGQSAT